MPSCKNVPRQSTKHTSTVVRIQAFVESPMKIYPSIGEMLTAFTILQRPTTQQLILSTNALFQTCACTLVLSLYPCKLTTMFHLCFHIYHTLLIPSREEKGILSMLKVRRKQISFWTFVHLSSLIVQCLLHLCCTTTASDSITLRDTSLVSLGDAVNHACCDISSISQVCLV